MMKHLFTFCLVALMSLSSTALTAELSYDLVGVWVNENLNLEILIESDYDGIRVRRSDQNRWYRYRENRRGEFVDYTGSRYTLDRNQILSFYDNRRRQPIRFYKSYDDNRRGDRYRSGRDRYNNRSVNNRFFTGDWYNDRINEPLFISRRGKNLEVTFRGKTRRYRSTRYGDFEDKKGNRIRLRDNNRLVLNHRKYRKPIVFRKDRPRNRNRFGCP